MSTIWTDEITCPTCGVVGQHVWSESGHMDCDERTVALRGDFAELPQDKEPWDRQAIGSVVCRRCGGGCKVLSHHRGQLEAPKTARPPELPWHAVAVLVDDRVVLRLYCGASLKAEVLLRWRQALLLSAQLTECALLAEHANAVVLDHPGEQDVA